MLASFFDMRRILDHRDLSVWTASMDLAERGIKAVAGFSLLQHTTVGEQLRRALVSIPANIAEGHSRGTTREFVRSLRIARGSLAEALTLLELARRLRYLSDERLAPLVALVGRIGAMLTRLIQSLRRRRANAATGE